MLTEAPGQPLETVSFIYGVLWDFNRKNTKQKVSLAHFLCNSGGGEQNQCVGQRR